MGDQMPESADKIVVEVEMNLKAVQSADTDDAKSAPVEEIKLDVLKENASNGQPSSEILSSPTTSADYQPASSIEEIFGDVFAAENSHYVDPEQLKLAATLFEDAKSNRFIDFKHDSQSLRLYLLYYKPILKWLQYLAIFIILALAVVEEPAVWPQVFPYWACIILELVALCYLGFRVIHLASFQKKTDFWSDKKNSVAIILMVLTMIDILCFSIWKGVSDDIQEHCTFPHPIRWSRPLRPLFIVNFPHARQIRRAFRNIRRTVVEIIFVLILFLFSVMLFALLALKLFGKRGWTNRLGEPYFQNYLDALWTLYVLVTTANNPDAMMPSYDQNNLYALFFISFLIVNLYLFMNVLLAVIFNSYKGHLKNEVQQAVFNKRQKLAAAYELVKERDGDGTFFLSLSTWTKLMKTIKPHKSEQQVKMLFQVMDGDGDDKISFESLSTADVTFLLLTIQTWLLMSEVSGSYEEGPDKAEFLTSADLLNVPLTEVKDRMILWDRLFPRLFNHAISKFVRTCVLHRFFRYFFDFAILVNAVFIALDVTEAEWFFLVLFAIEILLKLYVYGPRRFVVQLWNIFDVVVIGGAIIVTMIEAFDKEQSLEGETLDFILILRVLRLVKIFNGFDRFKIVLTTLLNIGPSIIIYGGVLFTFFYSFAIVGMEIFQCKITYFGDNTYNLEALSPAQYYCGNPALNGTEFWLDRYCSNNFNNIGKALVVLTELTVVNQWHVLTAGFVVVTHPVVKLFFLIFHLVVVVLIMNIFIAFILEAFILEYSLSKSKFESQFEAKILKLGYALGQKKLEVPGKTPADKQAIIEDMEMEALPEEGTRFHVRQSRRKVETLLQRMFEDELDPEDIGLRDKLEEDKPARKYTLDSVVN